MEFKISKGNSKIGKVDNINLPALVTCPAGAGCREFCYANKGTYRFASVKNRYAENYSFWILYGRDATALHLLKQLRKSKSELVRWHSSGDIPEPEYFRMMVDVALILPDKKFLAFTKRYNIVNNYLNVDVIPDNLSIVFSEDNIIPMDNPNNLPVAKVDNEKSSCLNQTKGINCHECMKCWHLKKGKSVTFRKH